jgi:hypothetical protein
MNNLALRKIAQQNTQQVDQRNQNIWTAISVFAFVVLALYPIENLIGKENAKISRLVIGGFSAICAIGAFSFVLSHKDLKKSSLK